MFSLLSRLSQSICFLASPHVTLTGGSQRAFSTLLWIFFYPFLNTPLALTHIGFLSCFSSVKLTNFHNFWPQESGHRSLLSFMYSVNGIVMLNLSFFLSLMKRKREWIQNERSLYWLYAVSIDYIQFLLTISSLHWLYPICVDYIQFVLTICSLYWLYLVCIDYIQFLLTISSLYWLYPVCIDYIQFVLTISSLYWLYAVCIDYIQFVLTICSLYWLYPVCIDYI